MEQIFQLSLRILGIETAVDETAAAIVENGWHILGSVVSSQVDLHAEFGGIVPEIAARSHIQQIIPVIKRALKDSRLSLSEIDILAVSTTPGLLIALLIGIETAKALSLVLKKPIVSINDLESHACAVLLERKDFFKQITDPRSWPLLYLIVSGGTTALILAQSFGNFQIIGQTRDDAAGEAFDKVAKLLGLGYPGGPAIEKRAQEGKPNAFDLPRPMLHSGDFDFSFSGLKTRILQVVKEHQDSFSSLSENLISDLAASFQKAVVETLLKKTVSAASKFAVKGVIVGGGVAANSLLRETFYAQLALPAYFPVKHLCTDNAAMVGGCAYFYAQNEVFTKQEELKPFYHKTIQGKLCEY